MPIYEYECASCGHKLEAFQKMSDAPLTLCPNCNKTDLHKLISPAGFQLKGTGWYVTDFRDKGKTDSKQTKTETKTDTTTMESNKTKDDKGSSSSSSTTGTT